MDAPSELHRVLLDLCRHDGVEEVGGASELGDDGARMDASNVSVGAVLWETLDGVEHPVTPCPALTPTLTLSPPVHLPFRDTHHDTGSLCPVRRQTRVPPCTHRRHGQESVQEPGDDRN